MAKPGKGDSAPIRDEKKREVLTKDAELKARALKLATDQIALAKQEYQRLYEGHASDDDLKKAAQVITRAEDLANKLTPAGIAADADRRLTKAFDAAQHAEQDHIGWLKSDHDPKTPRTNAANNRIRQKAVDDANEVIRYATQYRDQEKAAAAAAAAGGATKP
ncbi:hypothetical protein QRQ56_11310 [Bradyrhizobium sp. U531]|uniref:hypothetical protein n=1 Tax=Bradyrhizobium sp. U531 TaxID=3053458 RepID=UPI003F41DF9C